MSRPKTEKGDLLERYAAHMGLTVRSARLHRAKGVESWQTFMAAACPALAAAPSGETSASGDDLARAATMKAAAWRHWRALEAAYDKALGHGAGADTLGKYERAVAAAQERYTAAQKAEDDLRARRGLLVPYESVLALQGALEPLGVLFLGLKDRIGAGMADDTARGAFFAAFESAMPEWNSGINHLNESINRLLPCF
ncbi:MAG: hypothetical protein IJ943_09455 [Akkermansia sp.]|nr:hypothetical protein [Akkermansia sp.]